MIKKLTVLVVFAASMMIGVPSASANTCLNAGCVYIEGTNGMPGYWLCPNPADAAYCIH